ncbi:MAG: GNAT family N-acetyltransferase [Hyphomicrobiaceae bacterium]
MTEIAIRPATIADAATFDEIDTGLAPTHGAGLSGATSCSFLAEAADGKAAGFLEARFAGDDIEIIMLAIRPDIRRHGIATRLLEALTKTAEHHPSGRIVLEVAEDNAPARRLYAVNGYREIARRPGYYRTGRSGDACDALLLEYRLTGAGPGQDMQA